MKNVDSQSSISTSIELTSSLYLHPSDGSNSVKVEKFLGVANYRSWRRSFEISSKHKLGFVIGTQKRDLNNLIKQEAWHTCNCMVISWNINNVSDSIKKSIMFIDSAYDIWKQLEQRFFCHKWLKKVQID